MCVKKRPIDHGHTLSGTRCYFLHKFLHLYIYIIITHAHGLELFCYSLESKSILYNLRFSSEVPEISADLRD